MEILGHRFRDKSEEKFIQELLELFKTLYIDREIADKVIEIRKKGRIKLPECYYRCYSHIQRIISDYQKCRRF